MNEAPRMNESSQINEDILRDQISRICGQGRIFFSDIDGTLVRDDKSLPEINRLALDRFLETGGIFAVSTGRALSGAVRLIKGLGYYGRPNTYVCAYNGGQIFDTFHEKTLVRRGMSAGLVRLVTDCAHEYGIHIQGYTDTRVLTDRENENLTEYCVLQHLPPDIVPNIADALEAEGIETCKMLAIDFQNPDRITGFRTFLNQIPGDIIRDMADLSGPDEHGGHGSGSLSPGSGSGARLDIFQSNSWLLEIVPHGVNKGTALRYLAERLRIPVHKTISAGDAENDLPMICAAGEGCTVRNGDESLKKAADYVSPLDNSHGAVAQILCRFCCDPD